LDEFRESDIPKTKRPRQASWSLLFKKSFPALALVTGQSLIVNTKQTHNAIDLRRARLCVELN
jgi:hypothetical protein